MTTRRVDVLYDALRRFLRSKRKNCLMDFGDQVISMFRSLYLWVCKGYTSKGLSSRHSNTRVYYMNNGRRDVRVCKTAFLSTHAVTNGRLSRALKAYADNSGSPHSDL